MKKVFFASLAIMAFIVNIAIAQTIDTVRLSTLDPGFSYGSNGKDVVNGIPFYLLENDSALICISTVDVNNNQQGGLHKGAIMDVVHRRKFRENLDWTQFVISSSILTSWNYPNNNLTLDNFWFNIDTTSLYASGTWNNDTNIKVLVNYRLLPGTPVLKIKLWIINQSSVSLNAFLEYQIDPDESGEQKAYVPGVGWGNTLVNNGWNKNYVYNGVGQGYHSNNPAHGIAWLMNTPEALITPGYIFGVWFNVNTNAGDTTEIALYHITDIPDNNNVPNYHCIEKWSDTIIYIDPELSNYSQISGAVKDIYNDSVPGISIIIKDINGNVDGKTATDSSGNFKIFLEKGVYTFTVSGIGYALQSRSIDSNIDSIIDFTNTFNAAMQPVSVWAGFGKTLKNGIIQGTETDMVMENNKLAVSIANTSIDGQLPYSSKGRPLDLAVHGVEDNLDWIHLSFASKSKPTGTEAWQYESVQYDTIYVYQLNQNKAIVKTNGHYFELQGVNNDSVVIFNNISVSTTYTIEPGKKYIFSETIIANNTASIESFWIGDVIDYDGAGQLSYVPGSGTISAPFNSPATYLPSLPWIAMFGNSSQAYGLIYEGDFANQFEAYGNGSWIMSMNLVSINPGTTYQYNRYIVAASTDGFPNKPDAIQNIYTQLISQQTGISTGLSLSKHSLLYNDTLLASLTITNSLNQPSMALNVNVDLPKQVSTNDPTSLTIGYIPANSDTTLNWILTGISGGRGFMQCYISDTGNNTITEYESIFVNAGGWFAGDNHMHTTYSDGVGAVSDNVASAYQKGLSWVTITDHNTINHANDVNIENAKYDDFLVLFGQEVTTSPSHLLAYNITQLRPWNTSLYTYQQLIDSILFHNNGKGIAYLAHPYYPGLPWIDWSVSGYQGIEVWNGFYHATHSVNTQAFAIWDSLNTQGKHLFGIANSDAHNPGKVGDPHIVAYLDSLSKEEVYEAFNKGCIYGTNGPELGFDIEGKMMGSSVKIPAAGRTVNIHLEGAADQNITAVRLIKNGLLLQSWTPLIDTFTYQYTDMAMLNDFYRMEFEAGVGFAFSNPIWAEPGNNNALLMSITVDNIPLAGFTDTVYSYAMQLPAGTSLIPVVDAVSWDPNADVTILQATDLNGSLSERTATVLVTAEDGATQKQYDIVFSVMAGISEFQYINSLNCYPVPASTQVFIEFSKKPKNASFEIMGMNGTIVLSGQLEYNVNCIDVSAFANGIYFIKIHQNGVYLSSKKLIKMKF